MVAKQNKSSKWLVLLVLVLSALPAFGQRQGQCVVTGSVVTTDGQPAAHVNVLLKNTFYGAVTDSRGQFRFEAPAGEYTMQVFSITCHMREFPAVIRAGAGNHFSGITIVEDIKSLEQVVVTGQFSPQSLHNSVYKVRVIGSRQIEQKAANDVQSLLNTEIGVRLSNDMALGETDFELMGMSGNNVKVLIDGVPMVDRGSNKQSLSQIDVNSVERVEIVEGPMSVVYGTDALAGVINIITKKGAPDADKNTWSVSAGFQEESAGDEYALFDGKGLHRENVQLGWAGMSGIYANGGFTRYSTGGWQGDKTGRELMWQPKEQYIYNGVVGWKRGDLDMWYRLDYLDEELVTPANGTELHPEEVSDKKFATDRYTHQLQADWKISNRVKLNFASSYQSYKRRTTTIMMNTDTGEKWLSEESAGQDESKMQTFFSRATATWQAWPKLSFQPGVEWQWTKASGDRIAGEPTISDLAVYLSAEWRPLDWLNVRPGVRAIVNSGYDAPAAIPTLLTKFAITQNIDLRLSYAYGFRAPTLRELHFSFHNPNHNIDGNPDLKAEWSNNLTGALTWRILHGGDVRLTSTVSGFYNVFRDRIELVEVAPNTMQYTYGNIEKYKTTGGTLENTLMWKGLGASLNFSYIGRYNQLGDRDEYKDEDMTSFRWSPEVTASVTYSFAKSGTDLNLFYKFTGKRDHYAVSDDKVALLAMDSYHWADFTVSQKIGKYVRVNAGVKNIFDVSMVRNAAGGGMGSSGDASLLGYGRSFFLGASFVFNK